MGESLRYLVTGGAGFVGSHLVDALVAKGDQVLVLDDLSTGTPVNLEPAVEAGEVELIEGSTADQRLVGELLDEVDACYHLASAVGVQLVCRQPLDSLLANVHGCETVLVAAAERDRPLLFASTSEIYGKNSSGPLHEQSDRVLGSLSRSRWSYALGKSFGEMLAFELCRERGAQITVARLFNVVGPRQRHAYGMVLPTFVRQALAGSPLTVHGDGTQSRCFSHVDDIVGALLRLIEIEDAVGHAFNVGSSTPISIGALAHRVIELTGSDSEIQMLSYAAAYPAGFEELGSRQPDTTAVEELIDWQAERSIDEMITDVIAHERRAGVRLVA